MGLWPWFYDALAASLLLYHIYKSSKRGLAATAANFVGYLAAVAAASVVSKLLAPAAFNVFFRAGIVEKVQTALESLPGGMELAESAAELLGALPTYIGEMLSIGGYNAEELSALLAGYGTDTAAAVVDTVVAPAITGILTMVFFLLAFSLFMVAVHAITRLFYGVNRVPVIGFVNSVLGGAAGVLTGALSVYIWLVILRFVLTFTGEALSFLNMNILASTYSYRLLAAFEPFGFLS